MYVYIYIYIYILRPQGSETGGLAKTGFGKTGFMDVYSFSSGLLLTLSVSFLFLGNTVSLQTIYEQL